MKIIKIGASWCSGCVVMKSIWEKINNTIELDTTYYDFDIYEDMLKEKYHIQDKIPITIFLDNNGNELDRIIGETTYDNLINKIKEYGDK